jgi:signal transduction histidine kinase
MQRFQEDSDMTTASAPARTTRGYWRLWRDTPGSAVYLLAVFVLAITGLGLLAALFWVGVGTLVLVIGLPLVVLALFAASGFGVADRFLLRLTGLPEIGEPLWRQDGPERTGFWRTLTRPIRNGHYWSSLLHGMIVSPILSTITFALTVAWLSIGLGGLTYWFWGAFIPRDDEGEWGRYVADFLPRLFGGWSSWAVEVVLYLIAGVLFTITMPWVINALAAAHHAVARGMLGPWQSDGLAAEARAEAAARTSAVHAEDASLRRLERDIHDGPQQRLVRLQMDLAALERRADSGDATAAGELAREARLQAQAALDELRALSSGVAPPLLQDRGLSAALRALGEQSPVPATVEIAPGIDPLVAPDVARSVYFVVAELLTNAAKHAEATGVIVRLWSRADAQGTPAGLDLWVVDNGRGGARFSAGHGLAGLRERVQGLRGTLEVDSPDGGPTRIGAHIPLGSGRV